MGYRWSTSAGGGGGEFGGESSGHIGELPFFVYIGPRIGELRIVAAWNGDNHWPLDENNGIFPISFSFGESTSVPDPGSTLLLLGMSLVGLFAARRRLGR